jgi:hypothetical protein
MTVEQRLQGAKDQLAHRNAIIKAFGDPQYESSFEVEYEAFLLRREPQHQLWQITQDG